MQLLYGTSNPGKLQHMKDMLAGLDFEIIGLNNIRLEIGPVEEHGKSPLENARIKAVAYYSALKMPVFSCDSGLYIEGLCEEEQPGVYVRRVGGRELNDEEMIDHYSGLAQKAGGKIKARYKNAICLVLDESTMIEYDGEDISSKAFFMTSKAHCKRIKGFPLDSISIKSETGEYYMDIQHSDGNESSELAKGFRDFFLRAVAK